MIIIIKEKQHVTERKKNQEQLKASLKLQFQSHSFSFKWRSLFLPYMPLNIHENAYVVFFTVFHDGLHI